MIFVARVRAFVAALLLFGTLATLSACSRDRDLRGLYEVELQVPAIGVPIRGTLLLGSRSLDVIEPAWVVPNKRGGGVIADDDDLLLDANSCLVLENTRRDAPLYVMFFETRSIGNEIELPFGFFDSGKERIEVHDLRLFAGALAGELVYRDADGESTGRLYGDRVGQPDGEACTRALTRLRDAIDEAEGASEPVTS
ncbi:MAG: hypothetical protein AAGC67_05235 [Myxococcota bacterium]